MSEVASGETPHSTESHRIEKEKTMDWFYLLLLALPVIGCLLMMRMMMRHGMHGRHETERRPGEGGARFPDAPGDRNGSARRE